MASFTSFGNGPTTLYLSSFDELLVKFHIVMHSAWDTVIHLSQSQDIEELDWLLRLFTACDSYLESTCPFSQGDYLTLTTFLIDLETWEEDKDFEAIYALEDMDFIALDVEDR